MFRNLPKAEPQRELQIGTATYGARRCQYGGDRHPAAEVFDIDGAWCTPECREYDRQSETTVWRRWQS